MTGEAEFDEVFFTDVEVPASNLVGPLHAGWHVAMSVLTNERGHIGTAVVGLERRLARMAALADAEATGPIGPIERQRLAALLARGHAYRALAARQGAGAATAGSLLKLGITEMVFDSVDAPWRPRRRRRAAGGAGRVWHAGRTRRAHRRGHQPGAAQHHR